MQAGCVPTAAKQSHATGIPHKTSGMREFACSSHRNLLMRKTGRDPGVSLFYYSCDGYSRHVNLVKQDNKGSLLPKPATSVVGSSPSLSGKMWAGNSGTCPRIIHRCADQENKSIY